MQYRYSITRQFSASHIVPDHPECWRGDGHGYTVTVEFKARLDKIGLATDADKVRDELAQIIRELDHRSLNDMMPGVNTTPFGIAGWITERLLLFGNILSVSVEAGDWERATVISDSD